jgi:chromosome segregation ATPase
MQIVFELGMWLLNVSLGVALGLWWSSYYYGKLLEQADDYATDAGDARRYESEANSKIVSQLDGKIKKLADELESTRKLNVELARERDREKAEVSRLAEQRKVIWCELNQCRSAFKDITIHLHDMADTIASVAPNAKGD